MGEEDERDGRERAEEDAELVRRARSGESAAFGTLVERHQRQAVRIAYRLLHDVHDASDVAQSAFLRAYEKLESLEDSQRFVPWLMRIVSNLALNFRRARGRAAGQPLEGLVEFDGDKSHLWAAAGVEREASARERESVVRAAIAQLPDKQRLALTLFSLEGWSQKRIAEVMECSVELVKWNVFQARKRLKVLLADWIERESNG